MEFDKITDDQLESWEENGDGSGKAKFKFDVNFVKLHGKFTRGLQYRKRQYKITWVSVDRRLITFQRIETPEKKENHPRRRRPSKKDPKPKAPESFQLEQQTYVSQDYFGSREAGEAAVLENTPPWYRARFRAMFEEILAHPGFMGIASQMITGMIGEPPNHSNSVPSLFGAGVRRNVKHGLEIITTIKSPYDMRKHDRDGRHEYQLPIWGYADQKKAFLSDPDGWVAKFWSWWHDNFFPIHFHPTK